MDVVATHDDAPRGLGAVAPLQHVVIFKQYQIRNLLIKYDTSKQYRHFKMPTVLHFAIRILY